MTKVSFTTRGRASRHVGRGGNGADTDGAELLGGSTGTSWTTEGLQRRGRPSAQSAIPMRAGRSSLPPGRRDEARRDMSSGDLREARRNVRKRGNEARRPPAGFDPRIEQHETN
jgi:hypothetical protein